MRAAPLAFLLFLLVPALVAAQTVSGRVVDATTGQPVPARVEALETREVVRASDDGVFAVAVGPATVATLVVSHPGYYVQRLTLVPATTAEVEVALVPVVSVTDRIEVTATRAREGIDPVSFTNVPLEQVRDAYWGQDPAILLSQVVPGFYASNDNGHGIGYSYFTIRGFGQARTRVMLNGAPLNDAESGELFFIDLADFLATAGDVQVTRGVFGLSGLGGAVDITTRLPLVAPELAVDVGVGSFGTRRLRVTWDSGLFGGGWAFTGRYSRIVTDGYRDQSWVEMWNYYAALVRFGGRSRWRAIVFGGPERTHLAYVGVPRSVLDGGLTGNVERDRRYNPLTFPGEIDRFFQPHYQRVHEVALSDRTRFVQTGYVFQGDGYYEQFRANRRLFEYNLAPVPRPDGGVLTRSDLVRRRSVDEWDAGWVPTLSHARGRWTLEGQGEVRVHRAHHFGEVRWAAAYPAGVPSGHRYYDYRVAKDSMAAALEARVSVSPRVALTGGLQVTHHEYRMSRDCLKGVTFSRRYDFVLPRAGVVLSPGSASTVYAAVARGMREPFFRNIYDPQDYYAPPPARLDPEDVWNLEAGVSLRRERWRLRGNGYWMRFANEIVYAGALDDSGVPIYGNGARSRRVGVELDGSLQVARGVAIDGALSLSRNRFLRYREYDFDGGLTVYDGRPIAGYPALMASVSARGDWRGHRAWLAVRHVGEFQLDNTGRADRVNPAYTVMDVSARLAVPALARSLALRRVELELRGANVLGRRYTAFGYVEGDEPLYIPAAGRQFLVALALAR